MQQRNASTTRLKLTIIALLSFKVTLAALIPIVQDEAYYIAWSHHLAWGYLDHPPLVAFLAWFGLEQTNPFGSRVAAVLVGLIFIPVSLRLVSNCHYDRRVCLASFLLLNFSVMGLVFSLFLTPDLFLILAWTLAINELVVALAGQRWRWITLGIVVGLGFLSKYTMALFFPVIAWVILRHHLYLLRNRWPYLGAITALLVVSPHLHWNLQNDWVTLQFLAKRGLVKVYDDAVEQRPQLPEAVAATPETAEYALAQQIVRATPDAEWVPSHRERASWDRLTRHFRNYVSGQAGVWGFQLLLIIPSLIMIRRGHSRLLRRLKPTAIQVLYPATLIPLITFGIVAVFTKVEPNWGPMYALAAALLLAPFIVHTKVLAGLSLLNVAGVAVLAWHIVHPLPSSLLKEDRMLRETRGYREMAQHIRTHGNSPVFASQYQLAAMLNYYDQSLAVQQFPEFSRPSEFTRNQGFWYHSDALWEQRYGLTLVTGQIPPPVVSGFVAKDLWQFRICRDGTVHTVHARAALGDLPCPNQVIQRWYVVNYYAEPR